MLDSGYTRYFLVSSGRAFASEHLRRPFWVAELHQLHLRPSQDPTLGEITSRELENPPIDKWGAGTWPLRAHFHTLFIGTLQPELESKLVPQSSGNSRVARPPSCNAWAVLILLGSGDTRYFLVSGGHLRRPFWVAGLHQLLLRPSQDLTLEEMTSLEVENSPIDKWGAGTWPLRVHFHTLFIGTLQPELESKLVPQSSGIPTEPRCEQHVPRHDGACANALATPEKSLVHSPGPLVLTDRPAAGKVSRRS